MNRSSRPTLLFAFLLTCALALVPGAAASAAGCANETLMPTATNTAQTRAATLCLVNKQRARFGRKRLALSPALNAPAQSYAKQMVTESFFDHVSPAGSTVLNRIKRLSNYITRSTARYAVGENLAWGSGDYGLPVEIVKSWMASPGHRANILNPRFRDIGIGVAFGAPEDVGGEPAGTYATVFGQRTAR